ncbi:hypothetical protein [Algoriphagus limi]|uniref:Uncharacterized protein n=1 Tax=Algoriphagus limi TaxID=2975273 RepID=A0ABT2G270_9BACT|nr:hypothetical protein [Algoriphagus limi]MCS5488903.1 hypothetical protein [Algoriphagus limi]
MKKLEYLKLDFSTASDSQQPFYCPFTGGLLLPSDPFEEVKDFPPSVIAILDADSESFISMRPGISEADFEDFADFDELATILEAKISKDSGILIVEVGYYGNNPHDFGGWVILLEIPNAFIG